MSRDAVQETGLWELCLGRESDHRLGVGEGMRVAWLRGAVGSSRGESLESPLSMEKDSRARFARPARLGVACFRCGATCRDTWGTPSKGTRQVARVAVATTWRLLVQN